MKDHFIKLDKLRKLKYGFKSLKLVKEKYGDKKDITDILNIGGDEMPFFAYVGLVWEDETLTPEKVEELIEDTIPYKYTVIEVIKIISEAIIEQMGIPIKKKAKTGKKNPTPLQTTVKSRSK